MHMAVVYYLHNNMLISSTTQIKEGNRKMNKCANCGTEFEGGFCPECGTKAATPSFCPQCGTPMKEGASFCSKCGYNPATGTPSAAAQAQAQPQAQAAPAVGKSEFTGGVFANFGHQFVLGFVTMITLGIAFPFIYCWYKKWMCSHTYINGKQLSFDGNGGQLIVKFIIWGLLSIITIGIYWIIKGAINIAAWEAEHTHFADGSGDPEGSKFTGKWYQLFGREVLIGFITVITLSFGTYWAICYLQRWYKSNTYVNGQQLAYDGKAIGLLGSIIKWVLLTIITCGIYSFWLNVKVIKWHTSHIVFA